jgi:hypothetical protein
MPTTSSCRFLRILAHVDGSRQAWVTERNTSRSVLRVGSKGPRNASAVSDAPHYKSAGRFGTSCGARPIQLFEGSRPWGGIYANSMVLG